MSRLLRLLVVLLLAATLPVRGVAAATMLFCADSPVTAAPASAHAMHDSAHAEHAAHHDHHGAPDAHPADAQGKADASAHDAHVPADDGHAGCNAAGACCTGVVTGPLFPHPGALAPAFHPIPFHAPLYVSVDLAHAERPPLA